jgi:hypothetical protein
MSNKFVLSDIENYAGKQFNFTAGVCRMAGVDEIQALP